MNSCRDFSKYLHQTYRQHELYLNNVSNVEDSKTIWNNLTPPTTTETTENNWKKHISSGKRNYSNKLNQPEDTKQPKTISKRPKQLKQRTTTYNRRRPTTKHDFCNLQPPTTIESTWNKLKQTGQSKTNKNNLKQPRALDTKWTKFNAT